jgi:DNA replication protein DnaC
MESCPICGIEMTEKVLGFGFKIPDWSEHKECKRIIDERQTAEEESRKEQTRQSKIIQIIENGFSKASINWHRRTFGSWIGTEATNAVVLKAIEWKPGAKGLMISGHPGTGKTHLLAAMAINNAENERGDFKFYRFSYWSDLMRSQNHDEIKETMQETMRCDYLYFDDIGTNAITDFLDDKLCSVLDHRLEWNLPTFFTTNTPGREIEKILSARVISRLSQLCEWVNIPKNAEDWRSRKQ